jgi:hypothetical protein
MDTNEQEQRAFVRVNSRLIFICVNLRLMQFGGLLEVEVRHFL